MWIFQHSLYDAKGCSRHRGWPYLDFYQVVGRCHRDRSGDQLVVGQAPIVNEVINALLICSKKISKRLGDNTVV